MTELIEIAEQEKLVEFNGLKKQDLIFKILKLTFRSWYSLPQKDHGEHLPPRSSVPGLLLNQCLLWKGLSARAHPPGNLDLV